MDFKMHEYTHALVGKVLTAPVLSLTGKPDNHEARRQHSCYLRLLRELNLDVIEVGDEDCSFPENVFLEDLAIICNGIALFPKPSSGEEKKKMDQLKEILKSELGHTLNEVSGANAKILGSDILFTGREFFVGICDTTNEAGARDLAETFPEFPCTPIKMSDGSQHLKKYVTVAGPDVLCVGSSQTAKDIIKRMEREATFSYQTLTMPEDDAANCLYVNGTLIHRAIEEIPESFRVFCDKIYFSRRSICFSELSKNSAGLSACCLLVRKP